MSKVQTDNSHFQEKVGLRIDTIERLKKKDISVLEAFSGDHLIWTEIKKRMPKIQIDVLRIDQKDDKKGIYLKGDNLKFIKGLDLSKFDIIDLDAYGSPSKHLGIVFDSQFTGYVHCTFIQSGMGRLDNQLLIANGFTPQMIKKIPTLFCRSGIEKMKNYISMHGIEEITGYFIERKNYFYFFVT
jgi:hypothetical protein